jgi:outer membrane protein OmpU
MNNLKKIGLSALAGSLVAVSAYAGEVTVSGGASMEVDNVNGNSDANNDRSFGMGNQLTFTGGGELENGLNVSISFVLDQGDNETDTTSGAGTAPFDSHSITISSDSLGSLKMAGEGADSAQTAIDTTAAGDLWDNSLGLALAGTSGAPDASDAASGSLFYTSPEITDGLTLTASYSPNATNESAVGYGLNYTGIEGLSFHAAQAEANATDNATADVTTIKASYAYGPITIAASDTEYDDERANTGEDVRSYNISYTVSENISLSYGIEKFDEDETASVETAETTGVSASYTAGGMTLSATMIDAENMDFLAATQDSEFWQLKAAFAF